MIPKSNEIRFEVATACNFVCSMCPIHTMSREHEFMGFDLFVNLLDKVVLETDQYEIATFSGMGEPLLDPTIIDKMRYAIDRGFEVFLLTNGSKLTVETFLTLENLGVSSIRVSSYGATAEVYAAVSKISPDNFYSIRENLTTICNIKTSTEILFTYNIIKGVNDTEVDIWIKYWEPKADLLEVWMPHNWVSWGTYRENREGRKDTCGRPWSTPLQIQVDGIVNMCCFDYNGRLQLGDLKIQSLEDIFQSDGFKRILHSHTTGNHTGLICEYCDQRNVDKSDVMVYNSKYNMEDRVKKFSTNYQVI